MTFNFWTNASVKADKLKMINDLKAELDDLYEELGEETEGYIPSEQEKINIQNHINVRLVIIDKLQFI